MRDSSTRAADLMDIGYRLQELTSIYGRRTISVTYLEMTPENISRFTDWDKRYHGLHTGEEYYFIYANDEPDHLLYVVNVTSDSLTTAAYELMDLLARKF